MGWSYGVVDGREVGYAVKAVCDQQECDEEIDRGLAFVCGGMHGGGEHGCGDYFCQSHLFLTDNARGESPGHFMCEPCCELFENGDDSE